VGSFYSVNLRQTVKSVTLTVATDLEDVGKLEAEWNVLWQTCANTTPFQSPAWLLPYLHIFKPGPFKVLSIRRRERLIAVIPITIVRSGGQAVLRLLGQDVSDYMDGLCAEEDRVDVYSLIQEWLVNELTYCEFAEFVQLQSHALLRSMPTPASVHEEIRPGTPCPAVHLQKMDTGTVLSLTESMKKRIKVGSRQLRRIGNIDLSLADRQTLDTAISHLFMLHAKRWQRRGLPGIFANSDTQMFYRKAFHKLEQASALRLFTLYLDKAAIASLAAFCKDRILYYYIGAFDPDYARFGPGNLIVLHVMEFAIREGYETFDFLRGCEPYKYEWGAQNQSTYIRKLWWPRKQEGIPARSNCRVEVGEP
jgi:CelD/BcsL family acetyltransferase involved in cellulose biosynthesis